MEIVILTNDSFYPRIIVNHLIKVYRKNIKAIFFSNPIGHESLFRMFKKILLTSGFRFLFLYSIEVIIGSLQYPSIKKLAKKYHIDYYKTDDINKESVLLKRIGPDLIVSVSFLQILKRNIIDIPKKGCINLHGALLPKYKGRAVYFWMLLNEEKKIGSTIHFMNEDIDSGDIILQNECPITPDDTIRSISLKTVGLGIELIVQAIDIIGKGDFRAIKQNEADSLYTTFPSKSDVKLFLRRGKRFFRFNELIMTDKEKLCLKSE